MANMVILKKNPNQIIKAHDTPHALNLFFTAKCNLNCSYCFVNKSGQENVTIDEKLIKKSINRFFKYPGKKKLISFNGGEPLLEWSILKRMHLYASQEARKLGIFLDIVVVSNGTLITQDMIDFFAEYKTILKISIDGNKQTHDKQRPFINKKGGSVFDLLMKKMQQMNWKNLPVAVSMVFTPESVDKLNENIMFLSKQNFSFIEIYPDVHARWKRAEIAKLKTVLKKFEKYYISSFKNNKLNFKNSLLDSIVNDVNLYKTRNCPNIQIDCLGNFYVCDKAMSLSMTNRGKYVVGSAAKGIDDVKRLKILNCLREEIAMSCNLKCENCKYEKYCFCQLGSYIYQKNSASGDAEFWYNFCQVSGLIIGSYLAIAEKLKYNEKFVELYRF